MTMKGTGMKNRPNITACHPWHLAWCVADMPKKTGDYLMLTNMGYAMTFYWDARKRQCFLYSPRHHWENGKEVDDGKMDSFRISLKPWCMGFAWMEIPRYSDDNG